MPQAPLPDNESRRLAALHDLGILDTAPEQAFDALVQAAAVVCNVPISLISLVDTERQWFKANVGLPGDAGRFVRLVWSEPGSAPALNGAAAVTRWAPGSGRAARNW